MAKGKKTGGRRPGSRNKTTRAFKDAVLATFVKIGGVAALARWAKEHPTEFYTKVAPRLIPTEVTGPGSGGAPLPLQIELTHAASASHAE